ncbi:MAG: FAD binding domain-containing protein [Acidobacteria bacterium]|nr:FAD binding domain-containing protein [Acidobacteriota bacterium]
MKGFQNRNPKDLTEAVALLSEARRFSRTAAVAAGGSDLLGMIKDDLVLPDLLVNLKSVAGLDKIESDAKGTRIGGLVTLAALGEHALIRSRYQALAEAAESVATPQIRNTGTLAGNICQRPWCWYYRAGFPCFKAGGQRCYSVVGENQLHAIFGGGPSFIVHPSDTAPALVAFGAQFRIVGPSGEKLVPAADFFVLPSKNAERENILQADEILAEVHLPSVSQQTKSTYSKVLDREAWTHAVVSAAVALEMKEGVCSRAAVVLGGVAPVPWRLPKVEEMLAGQKLTPELAARAGEAAVAGARPLAKNAYKLPLTQALVRRTLLAAAA